MKVAIIGSRIYENPTKIKETIFKLKNKYGEALSIVSGGAPNGADYYAKKYAMEFGIKYHEYNPAHTPHNMYSVMSENYYGKAYHPAHFYHRNKLIVDAVDVVIAFMPPGKQTPGTMDALRYAEKKQKRYVVIN
jgi:predicted Rossmann fold nucleotide-binding protein DprA/Smf involved in DNA uptake